MKYELHPMTVKLLKQGHPWVTKDRFSLAFPKGQELLLLKDPETKKKLGVFLHDHLHPKVKARFLAKDVTSLTGYIEWALKKSIEKREKLKLTRDNYYICFGEADQLPGLYIQKLGEHVLVQYHAYIWEKYIKIINKFLRTQEVGKFFWKQMRIAGEQKVAPSTPGHDAAPVFEIKESALKYKLKMNLNHDIGIYTDMAALRSQIEPYINNKKNVLNLFSYTGAFSLQALSNGSQVTSVDLSKTYMAWLEENIELNNLDSNKHQSIVGSCSKVLGKMDQKFDAIICDPPSFSSNGKKRESSYDFYKKYWTSMWDRLEPMGVLVIFLNTHSITRDKFRRLVREKMGDQGKSLRELYLSDDCPILPNFPEGDYLKGFIIQKHT